MRAGRPLVTITMTLETRSLVEELAEELGISRSAVIERAVKLFSEKRRGHLAR